MYKIAYEVVFNPRGAEQIGELMSRMDLGITGIEAPQCIVMRWTTTTKINKKYKDKVKKGIIELMERDGNRIVSLREIAYKLS